MRHSCITENIMRLFRVFVGVVLVTCMVGCNSNPEKLLKAADSNARLSDFTFGDKHDHTFVLKNSSWTTPIVITKIEKSCSCASFEIESMTVAPRKSVKLLAILAAEKMPGLTEGKLMIKWQVKDYKKVYETELKLSANTVALINPDPASATFNAVSVDAKPVSFSIALKRGKLKDAWDDLVATSSNSAITATVEKLNANAYNLKVTLDPSSIPVGLFKDAILIKGVSAGKELEHSLEIPVFALITSEVSPDPRKLNIGNVTQGKEATVRYKIVSAKVPDLKFVSASSSEPDFIQIALDHKERNALWLKCKVTPGQTLGKHSGTLLVDLVSDHSRKVSVPYSAEVVEPAIKVIDPAAPAVSAAP
jgi:hypothetical protein